jgi:hypothetical protein
MLWIAPSTIGRAHLEFHMFRSAPDIYRMLQGYVCRVLNLVLLIVCTYYCTMYIDT